MPIIALWPLTASTPAVASKTCSNGANSWTDGTNRLDWTAINVEGVEPYENKALFLQRSSVDNNKPNATHNHYIRVISGLPLNPDADSLWTTIKTWRDAELDFNVFPTFWTETASHSTLYYYRLVLMAAHNAGIADELDSNIATIVQPFDLSICTVDACTIPQNCRTLLWDAPVLTVPFITGTHCPCADTGCAQGPWYKITVNWTYTPAPVSYDVYKSTVGPDSLVLAANTATSPLNACNEWFDSELAHTAWYQFRANRPNGSVINSNIVQISY